MVVSQGLFYPVNIACAKKVVTAVLIPNDGKYPYYYIGQNSCNNAQEVCPRELGEGYDKCKLICEQPCHAEIEALRKAGDRAKGSIIIITGINRCCNDCLNAMEKAGVFQVVIPEN